MATNPPAPPLPSEGATYQEVLTRLATVSSRMSDILRTLGIGTVVFCWGLFTTDKGLAQDVATRHRFWIVITAACGVLGLLFDLLQAVVAYWVANRLRVTMEQQNKPQAPYPYTDIRYRSQTFFFAGKAVLMPVATGSIIVLLVVMVWNPQSAASVPSPACCCQLNPANTPVPVPLSPVNKMGEPFLLPAPEFTLGNWDSPTKIEDLEKALSGKVENGDMLLLIGSTDCIPIKSHREELDNTKLALNRATRVRDLLQQTGFGLEMRLQALPQHTGCKAKADLRAVFPLLIRSRKH